MTTSVPAGIYVYNDRGEREKKREKEKEGGEEGRGGKEREGELAEREKEKGEKEKEEGKGRRGRTNGISTTRERATEDRSKRPSRALGVAVSAAYRFPWRGQDGQLPARPCPCMHH